MVNSLHTRIARRIKALREGRGFSQQELAAELGFNDRQTLAAIEAGDRRVSPAELARAAELMGVDVEHFTDAFRLAGEGEFSFRARDVEPAVLDDFAEKAGRWIATYRELGAQSGVQPSRLGHKLELTRTSSFEDAQSCAEEIRQRWRLGDVPAAALEEAIQRELQALVLYVDAPVGVSGAASQLPGLNTILVNRHEPQGRRSYDLGHELFHVLTWDAMPPPRVEWEVKPTKGNRVEMLAENFAAALLMPAATLQERWRARGEGDVREWLKTTARALRVSVLALQWRMHNLGYLSKADVAGLATDRAAAPSEPAGAAPVPPLFSAEFVSRVHAAVEAGRLSLRRAARLLDMDPDEFSDLCAAYGLALSYDA
ncbi:MAG TPA: XRE family transcriptional regulator [Longimicrobium sp.]|nr:XRE family transcriptional regulator [Longimicrobium sp.]